jgi:sulfite reductase (ferredoxin)
MNHAPTDGRPYAPRPRPSIAGNAADVRAEIEDYDATVTRFSDGLVPDAVFLENRLRHGVYGQRQNGVHMMRSKLPLGLISPEQLDAFADIAEHYGHGIAHLTTRQDIQVHFIALDRTADVMRVLDDADMTSREACGNVVRNVCADPLAGVHPDEPFDVTAIGLAMSRFLLRIPDGQSLGRKFKATLAGSWDPRFNLGSLHDIGLTATVREGVQGFHVVVGGGLGAVPHEAVVFTEFLPLSELFSTLKAMIRVFAAHGEKKRRARARMKFLVASWGIDRFRDEVLNVRDSLERLPAWTSQLDSVEAWTDVPLHGPGGDLPTPLDKADAAWLRTSVTLQRQPGYAAVQVHVPSGDLSPSQLRGLADLLRREAGDTTRIGTDQSLWVRWVSTDRLLALRRGLLALGLGKAHAGGLGDTVTCPGADTCKLGITTPRSLAKRIQPTLDELATDPRLEALRIHISGCPNSCAQHHIADIGFFGAAKTVDGVTAPHVMLLLGGLAGGRSVDTLGDGFGTTIIKLPAARVDQAVRRLTSDFLARAESDEAFGRYARRLGRAHFKTLLKDLTVLPSPTADPSLYREFGKQATPFKVVRGTGECAGAVVLSGDLLLMEADRYADLASESLDDGGDAQIIRTHALNAFDRAARALLSTQGLLDVQDGQIEPLFRAHIYDPGRIYEGVGHYFLHAHGEEAASVTDDRIRRLVVEAGLFVEEAHAIHARLQNPAGGAQ